MARLYNYCTYNGVKGGKFQSSSWDVCCPQWVCRPEGNPQDWICGDVTDTFWVCFGANPQVWDCKTGPLADWNCSDNVNPQSWICAPDGDIDWACDFVNSQGWVCDTVPDENWSCDDLINPEQWDCGASPDQAWEQHTLPPPAVFECIIKDESAGLDCGD